MSDWFELFGRLHPLVLHLPVGLIVGLAVLEAAALARRAEPPPALLVHLAAFAAVLSAGTGWVLHEEPDYAGGATMDWHEYLGLGVAGCALLTSFLRARGAPTAYRAALLATCALLLPAAHFGATMTHGEGFLLEPLRERPVAEPAPPAAPEPEAGPSLASYAQHVAPFFESRCISCHGERKKKGGLRLDSPEMILKGGRGGEALAAGDADGSEMLIRMTLPLDDEDRMPPEHKAQPSDAEIALVRAWIAAGASFDAPFELGEGQALPAAPPPPEEEKFGPAPERALAALRERLVHVQPVSAESNELWIDFAAPAASIRDDDARALLEPLADHVADLSLARTRVGDPLLGLVADMPRLRRLDLGGTAVTGAGLAKLRGHATLEELVLSRARLDDGAVETLLDLPALEHVWLWSAGVGAEAVARLRAARPGLHVEDGTGAEAAAIETEGELVFSGDAPPVDAPPSAPAGLAPVNAVCPVSGEPAKAKYSIVFEGRVIAFCCPNCPKEFWADPEAFRAKLP